MKTVRSHLTGESGQNRLNSHWKDRKSTRLNSSHSQISYAVFCLKKKKNILSHDRQSSCSNINARTSKHGAPRTESKQVLSQPYPAEHEPLSKNYCPTCHDHDAHDASTFIVHRLSVVSQCV